MTDDIAARVDRLELPFDARGVDDYGVSKWHLTVLFRALSFLYRNYFNVRCSGIGNRLMVFRPGSLSQERNPR